MSTVAFVALAGMGATLRWLATDLWPGGHRGTMLVNVTGAFLLGLLAGGGASATTITIVGAGGLGALTTFSRFAQDAVDLATDSPTDHPTRASGNGAILYLAATLVLGLVAAWLGLEIAS